MTPRRRDSLAPVLYRYASAPRRGLRAKLGGDRVGHRLGMERQRVAPVPVEGSAGEAAAQAMRAGWRHADHARGLRHAAALVEGGQEGSLPGRSPAGGGEDGRRGLRGRGWTVSFPRVDQRIAV